MSEGALPPVLIELKAMTSEFVEKIRESKEEVSSAADSAESAAARISAAVDKQLADEARLADEIGASFDEEARRASVTADAITEELGREVEAAKAAGLEFDETARKAQLASDVQVASSKESSEAAEEGGGASEAALLGIGAAAVGFSALSVKAGLEFQSSMTKVQGAAGLTDAQAKSLGNTFVNTMGKTTFSAQEMSTALGPVAGVVKNLAGGALTNASAMKFMSAAMDDSEATGESLGNTTSDLSQVMQTFGLNVNQADDAANTLYTTAEATGNSLDGLTGSVDRLHAKLGVMAPSLQDTSTLVVDLAQHGVTGSKGLMVVNTALTTLIGNADKTKAQVKALTGASLDNYQSFEKLGLTVFNAKGQFVGMQSILGQLAPKMAKMTQEQKLQTLTNIFGKAAATSLYSTISGGAAAYDKANAAVTKSNAVQDAAKEQAKTLHGEIHTVAATVEDLAVKWGDILIPVIQRFIGYGLQVTTYLEKHKTLTRDLAIAVGVVAGAWALWTLATMAWSAATAAATAVGAAFTAVLDANPIVLIAAALIALGVAVYEAYEHFKPFRDAVDDVGNILKDVWSDVLEPVVNFFKNNWKTALEIAVVALAPFLAAPLLIIKYWHQIVDFFSHVWDEVISFVEEWYPEILGVLSGGILLIPALIFKYFDQIKDFMENAWSSAYDTVVSWVDRVVSFIEDLPGRIAAFAGSMLSAGAHLMGALWSGLKNAVGDVGSFISNLFGNVSSAIAGFLNSTLDLPWKLPDIKIGAFGHYVHIGGETLLPALAAGGIVTSPTMALIGEAGPEAVVPLNNKGKEYFTAAFGADSGGSVAPASLAGGAGSGGGDVHITVAGSVIDLQGLLKAMESDPHGFMALIQAVYGQYGYSNPEALPTTLFRQR